MGWILLFLVIAIPLAVWARFRLRDLEDPLRRPSEGDLFHQTKTFGIFWTGSGWGH